MYRDGIFYIEIPQPDDMSVLDLGVLLLDDCTYGFSKNHIFVVQIVYFLCGICLLIFPACGIYLYPILLVI